MNIKDILSKIIPTTSSEPSIPVEKTKWDLFIDGVNRLPRPLFTFGLLFLVLLPFWKPTLYESAMVEFSTTPDMMWYIYLTILTFWFGTKLVQHVRIKDFLNKKEDKDGSSQEKSNNV